MGDRKVSERWRARARENGRDNNNGIRGQLVSNANWIRMKILLPPSFTSLNCICFFFQSAANALSARLGSKSGDSLLFEIQKTQISIFQKNQQWTTTEQRPNTAQTPFVSHHKWNEKWRPINTSKSIFKEFYCQRANNKLHKILCTNDSHFHMRCLWLDHCSMESKPTVKEKQKKERKNDYIRSTWGVYYYYVNGVTAAKRNNNRTDSNQSNDKA